MRHMLSSALTVDGSPIKSMGSCETCVLLGSLSTGIPLPEKRAGRVSPCGHTEGGVPDMDSQWTPIPGYGGVYWINPDGEVRNARGHILSTIGDPKRPQVDLRSNGQRERVSIKQLLLITFGGKQ